MSDALGFELPLGLTEPTAATSPLPFEEAPEESQQSNTETPNTETPEPVGAAVGGDETVH
jgi:hypothetical protein